MASVDGGSLRQRDENLLEPKHSVFLSHSEAQKSFVEQLCLDIEARDRYPYLDKRRGDLSLGCDFPNLIFEAINQCQVAVVVLSEEFFSRSKWPMLEFAALVKRKAHDSKLIIMPVFLGMTHAQCRDKGNHDRWLKQWQCWAENDNRIIIEEWRAALKVLGYTNGISLSNSDERMCRQEIVEGICKEVRCESRWDDSHVQGRFRLCKVIREKIEGIQSSEYYGVRILGIYGVGGIGKSTACMVLCNDYFKEFHGRVCHVEFGNRDELHVLQEVLKKLTDIKHELIENLNKDECEDRMKRAIKNERVLLAIDNVSTSHQIVLQAKNMLRVGFKQGSIVIVTARSLGELQNLSILKSECIEMPEPTKDDAMTLFLYHAAPSLHLKTVEPAIELLTKECVQKCRFGKGNGTSYHYHPLALKVLGEQLWNDREEGLGKLKEIDPFNQYPRKGDMHPVFSILRRSFDTLNDEDQLLFMDAAIFCPDTFWNLTINIFEWLSMVHGKSVDAIMTRLKGLKRKSLIENLGDGSKKMGMHDLWREFAVFMTSNRGEFDPRPWIYEKVYDLSDRRGEESNLSGGGWESLQRLYMIGDQDFETPDVHFVKDINLSCCSNLRVLKLEYVHLESKVLDVRSLKQLKSLEIRHYCQTSNLDILGLGCLRNLVYLILCGILSETTSLNEEIGGLTSLHVLHVRQPLHSLSGAEKLPDFNRLNWLRDVSFYACKKADIILGLSSKNINLKRLSLQACYSLHSCHGVGDLIALEELDMSGCKILAELPNLGRLKTLLKLDVSLCELIEAVPGLGDLVSLQVFDACGCSKLAELPDMYKLVNLQKLDVKRCSLIKAMPSLSNLIALKELQADYQGLEGCHDLSKLTKLETVWIRGWSAEGLPYESNLVNLKSLHVDGAEGVDELTGLLNLTRLQQLRIDRCGFKDVQCLSNLTTLTSLEVLFCDNVEGLPDMRRLSRLEKLKIKYCRSLREWKSRSGSRLFLPDLHIVGTLLHLQTLDLHWVAFTELPNLSSFSHLRKIYLEE